MKLKRRIHVNREARARHTDAKRSPIWCGTCGRKHSKDDECNLIPTDRGGKMVVGGSPARMGGPRVDS